jgi:DNA-binding NtrC family response regulator
MKPLIILECYSYNIESIEKTIIQHLLGQGYFRSDIAKMIGTTERTLYRKLYKYDLSKKHEQV